MSDPKAAVQAAPSQAEKVTAIHSTLLADKNYDGIFPAEEADFLAIMQDAEKSNAIYEILKGDTKYTNSLPDSTGWANIFKKKEETGLPDSSTGSPEPSQVVEEETTPTDPNASLSELLDEQPVETPDFDLNTAEGIKGDAEKRLNIKQGEVQAQIIDEIQAELDAGTITEAEAQKSLDDKFGVAEQELFDEADKDFTTRVTALNEKQSKEATLSQIEPKVLADNTSRVTNRQLTTQEIEAGREVVKQNEEKRKTFNKIANEALDALPTERETQPARVGGALGMAREGTQKQKVIDNTRSMLKKIANMTDENASGFFSGLGDQGIEMIPFIGALSQIPTLLQERNVLIKPEDQRTESEQQMVNALALMNTFEQSGLKPTSYEWGEMVGQMIPFLGEFALTGGVATSLAKSIGTGLIKRGLGKGALNYAIRGTSGAIAQATANPQQYIKGTIERMTPMENAIIDLEKGEIEKIVREKEGESLGTAAPKAYLSQVAEMLTERLGFSYGAGATKFMKSKIAKHVVNPETLKKFTLAQFAKRKGITKMTELKKFTDRVGFNGVVTEIWGEELPNMALNEKITGDRGLTLMETLNPLDENLLKMIVPMLILQGGMYAPTGFGSLRKFVKGKQLDKAVDTRKTKISKIKNGSVLNIKTKAGDIKKVKRVEGKWKFEDKNGKLVSVPQKQQTDLDNKYVSKQSEPAAKTKTTIKEDGTVVTEKVDKGKKAAAAFRAGKLKKDGETSKSTTEGKEGESKGKVGGSEKGTTTTGKTTPKTETTSLTTNEKVASSVKVGDTITDNTGATYQAKEVTHAKDGLVTIKDEQGVLRSISPNTVLGVEGAKKAAPATKKEKAKAAVGKVVAKKKVKTEPKTEPKKKKTPVAQSKKPAAKAIEDNVEDTITEEVESKKPLKDIIPDNPAALKNALSTAMRDNNRASERLGTAKEQGYLNKNGTVKKGKNIPDWVNHAVTDGAAKAEKVAKLRQAMEDSSKKATAKVVPDETAPQTIQDKINELDKKIRELEPASRRLVAGVIDKVHQKKKQAPIKKGFEHIVERVANLKAERKALRAELGNKGAVEVDINDIDPNAVVETKGKPKKAKGVTETDYTFKAVGMEGTIKEVDIKGGERVYYAYTADGKVSKAHSTAADAITELRRQLPRSVTQTGKPVLAVTGLPPSKSVTSTINALHTSPKVVRTELAPTKSGDTHREMKIFIEDGNIATVMVTVRGKPVGKNKTTGEINKNQSINNKALEKHPELLELMREPNKAKVVSKGRAKIGADTREAADIEDPMEFTEKGKDFAKKIRAKKIHIPKGALRASVGFEEAYNAALEIAANTMEAGGAFVDAFRAAMKHIRLSKWFQELSPTESAVREQMAKEQIMRMYAESGVPLEPKEIEEAVSLEENRIYKENGEEIKDKVHKLIFDRRVSLEVAAYRTRLFIEGINIQTNKKEREILPFIIENTGIPKELKRPDLEEAYENRDVAKLDKIAKKIKGQNDKVWKQMTDAKEDMEGKYVEDYITHVWDIPKTKKLQVVRYFTTANRWAEKRYITTLNEGISKFGLKPKLLDVSRILSLHGSMANNVTSNKKMVNDLKKIRIGGVRVLVHNTSKTIPKDWHSPDRIPALRGFSIDPRVLVALKPIFEQRVWQDKKLVTTLEKSNSVLKGAQLTVSLFHHAALIEAAAPLLGVNPFAKNNVFKAVGKESLSRAVRKGARNLKEKAGINNNESWEHLPFAFQPKNKALTEDALLHGVQIGASMDIPVEDMENLLEQLSTNLRKKGIAGKGAAALTSTLTGVVGANNALLWDYLHDTLKLMAYNKLVAKMPDKFDTEGLRDKYKIEVGQFVNDSFGGQHWDILGAGQGSLQAARWILLSPDWTLSTLRQAAPVVLGLPYLGAKAIGANKAAAKIGKAMGAQFEETAGVRAKVGLGFWFKAAFIYGIAYNLWNSFNRLEDMKENPDLYTPEELALENPMVLTMYGNTLGHKTHVFQGRNPDRSELYIREGKQFRELPELIVSKDSPDLEIDPTAFLGKLGGKFSPVMQLLAVSFMGKTWSGYENYDLKDKTGKERFVALSKVWAMGLSPFSFSSIYRADKEWKPFDLVFPSSKGMSFTKGARYLQHYMSKGDVVSMTKVQAHAVRNGLNIKAMFDFALSDFKRQATAEAQIDLKTVDAAEAKLASGNLSPAEEKAIDRKLKMIQKDMDEKQLGWELMIVNTENYIKAMEEMGTITGDEIKELERINEKFMK